MVDFDGKYEIEWITNMCWKRLCTCALFWSQIVNYMNTGHPRKGRVVKISVGVSSCDQNKQTNKQMIYSWRCHYTTEEKSVLNLRRCRSPCFALISESWVQIPLLGDCMCIWFPVHTQQDYYHPQYGTLLRGYSTCTYTEVTALLLWSISAVTM